MTEPSQTNPPPRAADDRSITETLMLVTFAIVCASTGGLLHLVAAMPAATASLIALTSMSVVVAANAILRRRSVVAAKNAQLAELRMEITGLRNARAAAPVARPRPPGLGTAPALGPASPTEIEGPRLPRPERATAPPPPPHATPPVDGQHKLTPPGRPPETPGAKPETAAAPTATRAAHGIDWTVRPGTHREPAVRLPGDIPAPLASGPLPMMPPPVVPRRDQAAASSHPDKARAGEPQLPNAGDVPVMGPPAASAIPPPRAPRSTSPGEKAHVPPPSTMHEAIDDLDLPAPDTAPRSMYRSGSEAWPRIVPKTPTSPLDLDTMQNLIEQLAGQLHHAPDELDAAPVQAPAIPASAQGGDTAPAKQGTPRPPELPTAEPAPAAEKRDDAPYAHLALIAEAVEAKRMDVQLDPVLGLSDRRARHFELSVRLLTEAGDIFGQDEYTDAAAGTGLLGRIDAEKLARAADVLQRLRARGSGAAIFSAVAGESLADDNFARAFADVLAAEEGSTSRLILTFQQAEARNFTDAHWRAVADMARIGLKFAMTSVTDLDMDFEVLKRQGFDFIKLDAEVFLDGLPTPNGTIPAADICRHLSDIGLGLIVGGIAAEKDLAQILGFGAILGQGALFGGPRSVELERERRAA